MMIYNGSRLEIEFLPRVNMVYHSDFEPDVVPAKRVFGPLTVDQITTTLAQYPTGPVCIDVEGSLVPRTVEFFPELRLWHWDGDFYQAGWRRFAIANAIPAADRGRFGFYESIRKDSTGEPIVANLHRMMGATYQPVYPQPNHNHTEWTNRLANRVGRALYFTGRAPRILVSYNTSVVAVSAIQFATMLKTIDQMGLDAVFWVGREITELPSDIEAVLWAYT